MSDQPRNSWHEIEMIGVVIPYGPYCRLCGRKLVDESDLWAGRCNNDENCARRVKEQVALSTSIVDEIVAGERIEKLEAEVERLRNGNKGFTSHCTDCCCNALWEVLGNPPYEPNGGIVERVAKMQAEVKRLKALPTAAQERAAIVAWLGEKSKSYPRISWCELVDILAQYIERGEHWPMEEEKE